MKEEKSKYCEKYCQFNLSKLRLDREDEKETKILKCQIGHTNVAKTQLAFQRAMANGRNCCYLPIQGRVEAKGGDE
ncbi:MAG: hypothetical protein Q8P24_02105 [Desulfobacterales bacterium]|nr:hypothetical protein [Desulfobacterales bacterium]